MRVTSKPGTTCPREGSKDRKTAITDNTAVDVPNTAYYRRLVRDGSLVLAPSTTRKPKPAKEVKHDVQ